MLFENTETLQAVISNPSDPAVNIVDSTAQGLVIDNDNITTKY